MTGGKQEVGWPWGSELVAEAEAFLGGRAVEVYRNCQVAVPAWARLNWLAHGHPRELTGLARREWGLLRPEGTWAWAVGTLAREILAGSRGDLAIVRLLQRDCLIPMELALMHEEGGAALPNHVVVLGLPRVRSHPSARTAG
jgi:hypothetical protein